MKKTLALLIPALLLLGAGCAKTPQSPVTTQNDKLSAAEMQKKCFPLKLANGNFIIQPSDAESVVDGSWDKIYDDDYVSDDYYRPGNPYCIYWFNNDQGGQVNLQVVAPEFFSTTSRPVAGLGERAAVSDPAKNGMMLHEDGERSAILDIQKNNRVLRMGCWTSVYKRCGEEDLLKMGKIAADRWK